MHRKIHLIAPFATIITYIAIALLVNAYRLTTWADNPTQATYRTQWAISTAAILVLCIGCIFVIGSGVILLLNLDQAPPAYRNINIGLGIAYLCGGLIFAPMFSIVLYFKE